MNKSEKLSIQFSNHLSGGDFQSGIFSNEWFCKSNKRQGQS